LIERNRLGWGGFLGGAAAISSTASSSASCCRQQHAGKDGQYGRELNTAFHADFSIEDFLTADPKNGPNGVPLKILEHFSEPCSAFWRCKF